MAYAAGLKSGLDRTLTALVRRQLNTGRCALGTSDWVATKYLYNTRSQIVDIEAPLGRKGVWLPY